MNVLKLAAPLLLPIALLTACATSARGAAAASSRERACSVDAECPGGSCRAGACSPLAVGAPECVFEADCPGGSCYLGECTYFSLNE